MTFLKELGGSTGAGLRPFERLGKPTLIWRTIYHELRRWAKASGGALSTGRDSIPVPLAACRQRDRRYYL
jgi:hypothetical protein